MTALITVTDLTMGWSDHDLLERQSFEVNRGEVFAILGRSGCGKSTLLRYLTGLDEAKSGTVTIDGIGPPSLEAGRPAFGVMFQSGALFGSMTVGENLALALAEWTDLPPKAVAAIVRAKLRLVGLQGSEYKHPSELSGGMRKRAAIARALTLEPSLIFLDEPSAGLDPVSAAELDQLILTLNNALGLTVVLATHDLDSIFMIATRCILLDRETKSIIARGDPRSLRDGSVVPAVHQFFSRTTKDAK
ncbi:MAG: polyamine ABC transporter ATP-binding protein [Deltaproteobacteria bacterium RIFOXYA12_FULL_58_15]|nr:MAG: polyamine ABC transporter ATP-binding protein [Deltaproteobacteria bacterium RIFOXYA12_FULL_58_15]